MDDTQHTSLPDDIHQLKSLVAQQQSTIAALTQERDEFYIVNLKLQVRLDKMTKQVFGPRAVRLSDSGQMFLDFGQKLESLPIRRGDVPTEENESKAATESTPTPVPRRIRTRGRRDIGSLNNLPIVECKYELTGDLCRCPACEQERKKIGEEI